jgi:hypothetical protein
LETRRSFDRGAGRDPGSRGGFSRADLDSRNSGHCAACSYNAGDGRSRGHEAREHAGARAD